MKKKIIAVITILVLLVTTAGATLVSAQMNTNKEKQSFFNSLFTRRQGPTLEELIENYEQLNEAKEEFRTLLKDYGIELPDLTNEQKQNLIQTIRELRKSGHTREQMRTEIVNMLIGFGVNIPGLSTEQRKEIRENIKTHLETNYDFIFVELTREEKAYMKQTLIQMKRQGKDREEIKDQLFILYEEYGGNIADLDDTEKEAIYDWTVSMIETDYDIDLPDISFDQRQEIKEEKDEIHNLEKELRHQFRRANWITKFQFLRYVKNDNSE